MHFRSFLGVVCILLHAGITDCARPGLLNLSPTPSVEATSVAATSSVTEGDRPSDGSEEAGVLVFSKPDFTFYHDRAALWREIKAMVARHPDILQLHTEEAEQDGYSAELLVVTVAKRTPEMQVTTPNASDGRIHILLNFGQHGREPVTSEVALRLLEVLVGEQQLPGANLDALGHLLPHLVIKIVPMENVNGRLRVEAGELCERKNGRGVDTNRNWGVDWGVKEKDYDPREEYPGKAPYSEPEVQMMRRIASDFRPHLWVNVHSGMEALFMPYDHKNEKPRGTESKNMLALLKELNAEHCNGQCVVGSGGGSVGYLAHGTATDWMFMNLHVPLAFTFEIYGENNTHEDDCFRMFNPVLRAQFERVVSNWAAAFVSLLLKTPRALGRPILAEPSAGMPWDAEHLADIPVLPISEWEQLLKNFKLHILALLITAIGVLLLVRLTRQRRVQTPRAGAKATHSFPS